MQNVQLTGKTVLLVDDEPLILWDLAKAFEDAGAETKLAASRNEAESHVMSGTITAAVLDHALRSENCDPLHALLKKRAIPFIIYSGYDRTQSTCNDVPHFSKPIDTDILIAEISTLISASENAAPIDVS